MKKQEIITRLRKFMEDANGGGSWKEFVGSQLEGDVANFVMFEKTRKEYTNVRKIIRCSDPMVCLRGCGVGNQNCKNPIYES